MVVMPRDHLRNSAEKTPQQLKKEHLRDWNQMQPMFDEFINIHRYS